jgi:hypothetical protein
MFYPMLSPSIEIYGVVYRNMGLEMDVNVIQKDRLWKETGIYVPPRLPPNGVVPPPPFQNPSFACYV